MWQGRTNLSWLKQNVADGLHRRDWRLECMAPGQRIWVLLPPLPSVHCQSLGKVISSVPRILDLQSGQDWLN